MKNNDNKEVTDIINKMDILTQSQLERLNQATIVQKNLFTFLDSQITKVISEQSVKRTLLTQIQERIVEEGFNTIPWGVVLKLLEIYSKEENEIAITLLNMIKDIQVKSSENETLDKFMDTIQNKKDGEQDNLTKEDIDMFKSLFLFMKDVKKSELPDKK